MASDAVDNQLQNPVKFVRIPLGTEIALEKSLRNPLALVHVSGKRPDQRRLWKSHLKTTLEMPLAKASGLGTGRLCKRPLKNPSETPLPLSTYQEGDPTKEGCGKKT